MPLHAYTTARDSLASGTWACSHALPTVDNDAVTQRDVTFRDAIAGSRLFVCSKIGILFTYMHVWPGVEGNVHLFGWLPVE